MPGGFKVSPIHLNKGLGSVTDWDETAIKNRAETLADLATRVWKRPAQVADVLETDLPNANRPAGYTLDDHPPLADANPMRPLFETFRKQVLAMDPCVSEHILSLYIAYKAETNFVDVVPQNSRLLLTLNMRFHELHDPKKIARDVTNIGRWGNGDVEVALRGAADMPYIMGLVRQSFEKQMGDAEVET